MCVHLSFSENNLSTTICSTVFRSKRTLLDSHVNHLLSGLALKQRKRARFPRCFAFASRLRSLGQGHNYRSAVWLTSADTLKCNLGWLGNLRASWTRGPLMLWFKKGHMDASAFSKSANHSTWTPLQIIVFNYHLCTPSHATYWCWITTTLV